MINVSKEFREVLDAGGMMKNYATMTLADGTVLNLEPKDFTISNNRINDGAGANGLPLGSAMMKSITLELMNDDDRFSEYDFSYARIELDIRLQLSETIETVKKGTYTVVEPETYGTVISITAVDDMYKADTAYDSPMTFPATVGVVLKDACDRCGIAVKNEVFPGSDKVIPQRPEVDMTYRNVIGYCAMFAYGNARINVDDQLEIISYDFSLFEKNGGIDGGVFDDLSEDIYMTGDTADGGSFNPWNTGYEIDSGDFRELNNVHTLYKFKDLKVDTDDIVVTGVQTTIESNDSDNEDEVYLFGEAGYVLAVDNPLFSGIERDMVDYLGGKLVGIKVRKFEGDHISDPTIEAMDLAYVLDRKQNIYQTVITDVDFALYGYTRVSNSAENAIRNSSKYYDESAKTIVKARNEARKDTQRAIDAYDIAVQNLTSLMTQSFGMFKTEEVLDDGSTIYYMHNKPTLGESQTIWKMTTGALAVSTDAGLTWNAGIDAQGNAVVNVLSAIGINFDWAKGGTLTLGGANNIDGVCVLLDSNGNVVGRFDKNGIDFSKGSISLGSKFVVDEYGNATMNNVEIYGGNMEVGEYFTVDPSGNVVANSLKSSNAQITGGSFTVMSGANGTNYIQFKDNLQYQMMLGASAFTMIYLDENSSWYEDRVMIASHDVSLSDFDGNNATITHDGLYLADYDYAKRTNITRSKIETTGNLTVSGTKSRVAGTENYGDRLLYCVESPSPMFSDLGEGKTGSDGLCYVFFDDVFAETVDTGVKYQVFMQAYGEGSVHVKERTESYFLVEGTPDMSFGWEVKVVQKHFDDMRLEQYEREENSEDDLNYVALADAYINNYYEELMNYGE